LGLSIDPHHLALTVLSPNPLTVQPSRNLVIVHTPDLQGLSDWLSVSDRIKLTAPDIDVRIASNIDFDPEISRWQTTRPSLVFSPVALSAYVPTGGKVYAGRAEDKLDQVKRLSAAGLAVPKAFAFLPFMPLRREVWGEFVIVKPRRGSGGAFVRLVRTEEAGPRYLELTNNQTMPMMVQKFIDHADEAGRLIQCRVLTLFSRPLYASCWRSIEPRRPLSAIADDRSARIAINDPGASRVASVEDDIETLRLASRVGDTYPDVPCLGVDIVRERSSGKLYVLETNSGGNVWHFSANRPPFWPPALKKALYEQFRALDLTADLLIEKTRKEAQ
jgi:hypothetical protein